MSNFQEIMSPIAVENPGMETHIHPYQLFSVKNKEPIAKFLNTSPEFYMKEVLAKNPEFQNIYSLNYSFRDEPNSPIHRNQFLMLEWYRKSAYYTQIMDDIISLINFLQTELKLENPIQNFSVMTINEVFLDILGLDILNFLDKNELIRKIQLDYKDVPLPHSECEWDDYYFLLFLNKIEPELTQYPFLLLKEFPAPLSALSTISQTDKRVCERFEVYMNGVEICNSFNEITDARELTKRFNEQAKLKKEFYHYELPWPSRFMKTMEDGYPKSSGIALGVERLMQILLKLDSPFID